MAFRASDVCLFGLLRLSRLSRLSQLSRVALAMAMAGMSILYLLYLPVAAQAQSAAAQVTPSTPPSGAVPGADPQAVPGRPNVRAYRIDRPPTGTDSNPTTRTVMSSVVPEDLHRKFQWSPAR